MEEFDSILAVSPRERWAFGLEAAFCLVYTLRTLVPTLGANLVLDLQSHNQGSSLI